MARSQSGINFPQDNPDLGAALLRAWTTSNQTTVFLTKNIPDDLWIEKVPGYPRKTIGMLCAHIHNARCMWITSIDKPVKLDQLVRSKTTRKEVTSALGQSNNAMLALLRNCLDNGGWLPVRPPWLNFPEDVLHLLTYMIAHEAHHRGQIVMAAHQLKKSLPADVVYGLWQWTKRLKETRS